MMTKTCKAEISGNNHIQEVGSNKYDYYEYVHKIWHTGHSPQQIAKPRCHFPISNVTSTLLNSTKILMNKNKHTTSG
jgi:hypothetical protein